MLIVDTREQHPIWEIGEVPMVIKKLDEGDYTTEKLLGIAHIERKSGNDLYGSVIGGHERFRREIERAIEKKLTLAIFVECPKEKFIAKSFKGGYRLKCRPAVLRKIVDTIQTKYNLEFVWCKNREDFKIQATLWFSKMEEKISDGK